MNKIKITKALKIGFLATVLSCSLATTSKAEGGIQISPLTYEYSIAPGSAEKATMFLRNLYSTPIKYVLESENFQQVSDEGVPTFDPAEANIADTLAGWIDFGAFKEGTLEAGEQKSIEFTVNLPAIATPGGHYAGVFARVVPDLESGSQIAIASRVGATMLVSVDGDIKKSSVIDQFNFVKFIKTIGKNEFSAKIKNTGNVYFKSSVKVEVKNMFGKTETVDLGTHMIAHNNARNYSGKWDNQYPIGRYTATVIAQDDSGRAVTQSETFWALPLQIAIPAVIILVFLIVAIVLLTKNRKNSSINY